MRKFAALIFVLAVPAATAAEMKCGVFRVHGIQTKSDEFVVNPGARSRKKITINSKLDLAKTVGSQLEIEVRLLGPCMVRCEGEVLKILNILPFFEKTKPSDLQSDLIREEPCRARPPARTS